MLLLCWWWGAKTGQAIGRRGGEGERGAEWGGIPGICGRVHTRGQGTPSSSTTSANKKAQVRSLTWRPQMTFWRQNTPNLMGNHTPLCGGETPSTRRGALPKCSSLSCRPPTPLLRLPSPSRRARPPGAPRRTHPRAPQTCPRPPRRRPRPRPPPPPPAPKTSVSAWTPLRHRHPVTSHRDRRARALRPTGTSCWLTRPPLSNGL